jgi:hypothetical protein
MVRSAVDGAFGVWTEYVGRKFPPPAAGSLAHVDVQQVRKISFSHHVLPVCSGNVDLTVVMGTSTLPQIQRVLEDLEDPLAFATWVDRKSTASWRPGYIWISPPKVLAGGQSLDWNQPGIMQAAITHELGHVFGNPHIAGTIMDDNFVKRLWSVATDGSPEAASKYLLSIDQERELARCLSCARTAYQGRFRRDMIINEERGTFARLTGSGAPSPFSYTLELVLRPALCTLGWVNGCVQLWIILFQAFRAYAVRNFRFRIFTNIDVNLFPITFVVTDLFTKTAKRQ